jgi:hypothetical protein
LWCEENRLYSRIKGEMSQKEQVEEFYADKQLFVKYIGALWD